MYPRARSVALPRARSGWRGRDAASEAICLCQTVGPRSTTCTPCTAEWGGMGQDGAGWGRMGQDGAGCGRMGQDGAGWGHNNKNMVNQDRSVAYRVQAARRLLEEGMSNREVQQVMGISRQTMTRYRSEAYDRYLTVTNRPPAAGTPTAAAAHRPPPAAPAPPADF